MATKYAWINQRIGEMEEMAENTVRQMYPSCELNYNDLLWMYGSNSARFDRFFFNLIELNLMEDVSPY